ncbi:MAG: ompetence-damaged protein [Polaromonas sp.]|nr:ompetence-damaged protein [Polaromonas sp.]
MDTQTSRPPATAPRDDGLADQLAVVAAYMKSHALRMTTAESCTAGLIAAHLADVPGAGALLESAFVVYSPEAKKRCLGVKPETLERHNLTSEAVAAEMARGALSNSDVNLAVSNTGVTDDTDPAIPAGTQCFAWLFAAGPDHPEALFTETRRFGGDRNSIRAQAAAYALMQVPHKHRSWWHSRGGARPPELVLSPGGTATDTCG